MIVSGPITLRQQRYMVVSGPVTLCNRLISHMCCFMYLDYDFECFPMFGILHVTSVVLCIQVMILNVSLCLVFYMTHVLFCVSRLWFWMFPYVWYSTCHTCCFVYPGYDFECFPMFGILHDTCVVLCIQVMILNVSLCLVFYMSHVLFCVSRLWFWMFPYVWYSTCHMCCFVYPDYDFECFPMFGILHVTRVVLCIQIMILNVSLCLVFYMSHVLFCVSRLWFWMFPYVWYSTCHMCCFVYPDYDFECFPMFGILHVTRVVLCIQIMILNVSLCLVFYMSHVLFCVSRLWFWMFPYVWYSTCHTCCFVYLDYDFECFPMFGILHVTRVVLCIQVMILNVSLCLVFYMSHVLFCVSRLWFWMFPYVWYSTCHTCCFVYPGCDFECFPMFGILHVTCVVLCIQVMILNVSLCLVFYMSHVLFCVSRLWFWMFPYVWYSTCHMCCFVYLDYDFECFPYVWYSTCHTCCFVYPGYDFEVVFVVDIHISHVLFCVSRLWFWMFPYVWYSTCHMCCFVYPGYDFECFPMFGILHVTCVVLCIWIMILNVSLCLVFYMSHVLFCVSRLWFWMFPYVWYSTCHTCCFVYPDYDFECFPMFGILHVTRVVLCIQIMILNVSLCLVFYMSHVLFCVSRLWFWMFPYVWYSTCHMCCFMYPDYDFECFPMFGILHVTCVVLCIQIMILNVSLCLVFYMSHVLFCVSRLWFWMFPYVWYSTCHTCCFVYPDYDFECFPMFGILHVTRVVLCIQIMILNVSLCLIFYMSHVLFCVSRLWFWMFPYVWYSTCHMCCFVYPDYDFECFPMFGILHVTRVVLCIQIMILNVSLCLVFYMSHVLFCVSRLWFWMFSYVWYSTCHMCCFVYLDYDFECFPYVWYSTCHMCCFVYPGYDFEVVFVVDIHISHVLFCVSRLWFWMFPYVWYSTCHMCCFVYPGYDFECFPMFGILHVTCVVLCIWIMILNVSLCLVFYMSHVLFCVSRLWFWMFPYVWYSTCHTCCFVYPDYDFECFPMFGILHVTRVVLCIQIMILNVSLCLVFYMSHVLFCVSRLWFWMFPYVWYSTCHMCCFMYPDYDFECFPMFGILHVTCVVLCIQIMILNVSLCLVFYMSHVLFCVSRLWFWMFPYVWYSTCHMCCFMYLDYDFECFPMFGILHVTRVVLCIQIMILNVSLCLVFYISHVLFYVSRLWFWMFPYVWYSTCHMCCFMYPGYDFECFPMFGILHVTRVVLCIQIMILNVSLCLVFYMSHVLFCVSRLWFWMFPYVWYSTSHMCCFMYPDYDFECFPMFGILYVTCGVLCIQVMILNVSLFGILHVTCVVLCIWIMILNVSLCLVFYMSHVLFCVSRLWFWMFSLCLVFYMSHVLFCVSRLWFWMFPYVWYSTCHMCCFVYPDYDFECFPMFGILHVTRVVLCIQIMILNVSLCLVFYMSHVLFCASRLWFWMFPYVWYSTCHMCCFVYPDYDFECFPMFGILHVTRVVLCIQIMILNASLCLVFYMSHVLFCVSRLWFWMFPYVWYSTCHTCCFVYPGYDFECFPMFGILHLTCVVLCIQIMILNVSLCLVFYMSHVVFCVSRLWFWMFPYVWYSTCHMCCFVYPGYDFECFPMFGILHVTCVVLCIQVMILNVSLCLVFYMSHVLFCVSRLWFWMFPYVWYSTCHMCCFVYPGYDFECFPMFGILHVTCVVLCIWIMILNVSLCLVFYMSHVLFYVSRLWFWMFPYVWYSTCHTCCFVYPDYDFECFPMFGILHVTCVVLCIQVMILNVSLCLVFYMSHVLFCVSRLWFWMFPYVWYSTCHMCCFMYLDYDFECFPMFGILHVTRVVLCIQIMILNVSLCLVFYMSHVLFCVSRLWFWMFPYVWYSTCHMCCFVYPGYDFECFPMFGILHVTCVVLCIQIMILNVSLCLVFYMSHVLFCASRLWFWMFPYVWYSTSHMCCFVYPDYDFECFPMFGILHVTRVVLCIQVMILNVSLCLVFYMSHVLFYVSGLWFWMFSLCLVFYMSHVLFCVSRLWFWMFPYVWYSTCHMCCFVYPDYDFECFPMFGILHVTRVVLCIQIMILNVSLCLVFYMSHVLFCASRLWFWMFPYVWYSTCHMCCFVYPDYDFECFPMFGILHVTRVVLCIQIMILNASLCLVFYMSHVLFCVSRLWFWMFPYVWYSTCHTCCFVYPGYDFECFPMFGILHLTCVVLCIQIMILNVSLCLVFYMSHVVFCVSRLWFWMFPYVWYSTCHMCCFVYPGYDFECFPMFGILHVTCVVLCIQVMILNVSLCLVFYMSHVLFCVSRLWFWMFPYVWYSTCHMCCFVYPGYDFECFPMFGILHVTCVVLCIWIMILNVSLCLVFYMSHVLFYVSRLWFWMFPYVWYSTCHTCCFVYPDYDFECFPMFGILHVTCVVLCIQVMILNVSLCLVFYMSHVLFCVSRLWFWMFPYVWYSTCHMCCFMYLDYDFECFPMFGILHVTRVVLCIQIMILNVSLCLVFYMSHVLFCVSRLWFWMFPYVWYSTCHMCCFVYPGYDFECFPMFGILHVTCVVLCIQIMILNVSLCLVFYMSHVLFCASRLWFWMFPYVWYSTSHMCCFVYPDYDFECFPMFGILHVTRVVLCIQVMILNVSLCLVFYMSHVLFYVSGLWFWMFSLCLVFYMSHVLFCVSRLWFWMFPYVWYSTCHVLFYVSGLWFWMFPYVWYSTCHTCCFVYPDYDFECFPMFGILHVTCVVLCIWIMILNVSLCLVFYMSHVLFCVSRLWFWMFPYVWYSTCHVLFYVSGLWFWMFPYVWYSTCHTCCFVYPDYDFECFPMFGILHVTCVVLCIWIMILNVSLCLVFYMSHVVFCVSRLWFWSGLCCWYSHLTRVVLCSLWLIF